MTNNARLKILMIASTFPVSKDDFRNKMVLDLARELKKKGNDIVVLAPFVSDSKDKEYIIDGVKVFRFHYFFPFSYERLCEGAGIPANIGNGILPKIEIFTYIISSFFYMFKIVRKFKFDIIHAHWPIPNSIAPIFLKLLYKIPLLNTIYGAEVYLSLKYHISKIFSFITNQAEINIAISKGTCKIARKAGVKKLSILPLGVNTDFFTPLKSLKKKNGIKIISIGRLVERKGFEYLLIAFSNLYKKYKDIELDIVGIGPLNDKLKMLSIELGINKKVNFLGARSHKDIKFLFEKSDIFVLSSIVDSKGDTEGLGLVYLEAMASGLPVIGTKVGGIPDIIKNGFNGLLVKEKDVKELTFALEKLIKNSRLRNKLGQNGRKFVEENYSWKKIADEYLKSYRKVIVN